jgi:hypothetical protein
MPRVKSLSMAQCCKLVYMPISPTPLGVFSTIQCSSSFFTLLLYNFICLCHFYKSMQFFNRTLLIHIATHITNHNVVREQLWIQKNSMTIFSFCFLLKATHRFWINCSFFQAPHSFHDGLAPVHPHGSNYYPSMAKIHSNILHSSKCHHHHLSLHPSSFIMSTMCVVVYSN